MPRALCCFLCRVRLHDGRGVKGVKRDRGPDALPGLLRTRLLARSASEALVWGKAAERAPFLFGKNMTLCLQKAAQCDNELDKGNFR